MSASYPKFSEIAYRFDDKGPAFYVADCVCDPVVISALANSQDAAIVTCAIKGGTSEAIVGLNKKWSTLCGYEPVEVIGRSPKLLQGTDTDVCAASRFSKELQLGAPEATVALINYSKNGHRFLHHLHSTRFVSDDAINYVLTEGSGEGPQFSGTTLALVLAMLLLAIFTIACGAIDAEKSNASLWQCGAALVDGPSLSESGFAALTASCRGVLV